MASVTIEIEVNNHTYRVEREIIDNPMSHDLHVVKADFDRAVGQIKAAMAADQWREET